MQTVLVGFQCDPALKAEIVAAAAPLTVSQYLRSALVDKLRADGFRVPKQLAEAPSRMGKGGPRKRLTILHATELHAAETPEPSSIPTPPPKPVRYSAKKTKGEKRGH